MILEIFIRLTSQIYDEDTIYAMIFIKKYFVGIMYKLLSA